MKFLLLTAVKPSVDKGFIKDLEKLVAAGDE